MVSKELNLKCNVDRGVQLVRELSSTGPLTLTKLKHIVVELAAKERGQEASFNHPPDYVLHVGQVATLAGISLINEPSEVQEVGQKLAWSHDIGRAVDLGKHHPIVGARMLEELKADSRLALFAVGHHRWGMGERAFANGVFPQEVIEAWKDHTIEKLYDRIEDKFGIASMAVLLADNSKVPAKPGAFIPKICEFTEDLGMRLIDVQIERGRYEKGSLAHRVDMIGMYFLLGMGPYIESRLGIHYPSIVAQAQHQWENVGEPEIIDLWNRIAYDPGYDAQNH